MGGWMGGWVDGWVGGSKSRVKDCLQQSKSPVKEIKLLIADRFNLIFIFVKE